MAITLATTGIVSVGSGSAVEILDAEPTRVAWTVVVVDGGPVSISTASDMDYNDGTYVGRVGGSFVDNVASQDAIYVIAKTTKQATVSFAEWVDDGA